MKQYVDYTVIEADDIKNLIKLVNENIQLGWQPQGGICEGGTNEKYKFFQAMSFILQNKQ